MTTWKITLIFVEPLLGTVGNKKAWIEHIAADLDDDLLSEELDTNPDLEAGLTGFHQNGDGPVLYDYAIKGYLKDACGMLRRVPNTASAKLTAYQKVIDGLVFVAPRMIPLALAGEIDVLERPLRAQTARGERVAIARSQSAPAGTSITFTVTTLGKVDAELLTEWLTYGQLRGLGQWRNGGFGRFTYTMEEVS